MPPDSQQTSSLSRIAAAFFLTVCTVGGFAWPAAAADRPASVRLVSLDNGDRGCYVTIRTAKGEQSLLGDFDLCPGGAKDASGLVGKFVAYTAKKTEVMAASCAGAENCRKTDLVDLVMTLTPARAQPPVPLHILGR